MTHQFKYKKGDVILYKKYRIIIWYVFTEHYYQYKFIDTDIIGTINSEYLDNNSEFDFKYTIKLKIKNINDNSAMVK